MSFEAKSLNDILADALFQCDDCKGRGKREYAVWPKRELKVEQAAEVINEASEDYQPPTVEFRTCDRCKGTGRSQ